MPVSRFFPLPLPLPSPAAAPKSRSQVVEPRSLVPSRKTESEPRATACELWLALHLPQFMLDALGDAIAQLRATTLSTPPPPIASTDPSATSPAPAHPVETLPKASASKPIAVVDLEHGGKVIRARDATAAAAGIVPGMALNSALALLPEMQTLARDPQREHELLVAVAEWAWRFSPRVSLEPPDAVLLEVRGSLRLFGGSRRLCERLRTELRVAGLEPHMALTPTPLASLWMARVEREGAVRRSADLASRLADLPLRGTRWPARSLETLGTMGIRTLGECLRLPRDGFARRFGPGLLDTLDRALGRKADPREHFFARERFVTARDLEPEITDTARLDVACAPLLEELCAFLRKRRGNVQTLELRLVHREATPTRLRLRFAEPVGEAGRIEELLRERLARVVLPEPVRALRLRSGPLLESREVSTELFALDRRRSGEGVPQLVERLRARLGTEAVHGLCLVPEHRPESAWCVAEPSSSTAVTTARGRSQVSKSEASPPSGTKRPLWLLDEPQPLGDGDGDAPCFEGPLQLEQGPERIESGWWDGRDVRRDYYVARTRAGARLWIFRERQPQGRWFLHGLFS